MNPLPTLRKQDLIGLFLIVLLGAFLRVYGISWALPNEAHLFSYHSNEYSIVSAAYRLNLFEGQMNPQFFDYGSHYIYANYFSYLFGNLLGWVNLQNPQGWFGQDAAPVYLLGRFLSCGYSLLTILLVYFSCLVFLEKRSALLAALFVSICPLLVNEAHFNTVESCLGFFCWLGIFVLLNLAQVPSKENACRAGFVCGLAISVKYSALLLMPLALICLLWNGFKTKDFFKFSVMFSGSLILGFLLTMPYALLDFAGAWKSFYTETILRPRTPDPFLFGDTGNGFVYLLTTSLPTALGVPLLALSLTGALLAIRELVHFIRKRTFNSSSLYLIGLFILMGICFFVFGLSKTRYIRYLITLAPILCVFASWVVIQVWDASKKPWQRALIAISAAVVILYTGVNAWARALVFTQIDTRDEVAAWINSHVKKDEIVALSSFSMFRSPPIFPPEIKKSIGPDGKLLVTIGQAVTPYKVIQTGYSAQKLHAENPDYVILNEALERTQSQIKNNQNAQEFWQALAEGYQKPHVFENPMIFLGFSFQPPSVPYDWDYVSPRLLLFEKKR